MSSIIERLTEGVVSRDMRSESHALLSKWEKTGLLEGLETDRSKNTMARLLENQAKELLREQSSMSAGDVEGFASVAFPIVRRVFAGLIANDLVSVQPMSLPSGLIFFLDFVYSPDLGGSSDASGANQRHGNVSGSSIYGTDRVGSQITGGVNLVGSTYKQDFSGPRTAGGIGYAYASPTGSNDANIADTSLGVKAAFLLNGDVSETNAKLIQYDPDLLASTDSSLGVVVLDVKSTDIANDMGTDYMDFDNMAAFVITDIGGGSMSDTVDALGANPHEQVRRLTRHITDTTEAATSADSVRVVLLADGADVTAGTTSVSTDANSIASGKFEFPLRDHIKAGGSIGAVVGATEWGLEGSANIPEIDIKVDSIAVTAQTKKLKAKWTPELGQDLNAYHNLDAEVELTSILSEQIALEIDREILADLINGATAATYYWSRSPGLFVNRTTGAELGASSAAPDFTGTVSEWYETLVETINDVSAQIHRKTLRGGANFLVCSPEVANILEFTAGFRASVTHDSDSGSVGAVNVGSLSKKFDVIVDPYFLRQVVLVGRRGSSFLESGYVYAPYVPLQTTPTIFGVEDFVPRKGVMTRYAKKMVRPDMYGLVICRGILGEEGSS